MSDGKSCGPNSTAKTGEPPKCSHQLWAVPGTVGHPHSRHSGTSSQQAWWDILTAGTVGHPHSRHGGTSSQQPWPCGASALSL